MFDGFHSWLSSVSHFLQQSAGREQAAGIFLMATMNRNQMKVHRNMKIASMTLSVACIHAILLACCHD